MPDFDLISGGGFGGGSNYGGVSYGGATSYGGGSNTLNNIASTFTGTASAIGSANNAVSALSALSSSSNPAQSARLIGSSLYNIANAVNAVNNVAAIWSEPNQNGFNVGGPGAPGNRGYGSGGTAGGGAGGAGGVGGASYGGTPGGMQGNGRAGSQNWKVRVRCPGLRGAAIVFPITPTIQTTDTAKYSPVGLTHSNYAMQFYECSEVSAISISAEFPVQNAADGVVLLSAISLFRAATKMFWGSEALAGTPPPLLFLDGYGGYFTNVPCILTNFTHTMPDDKDYIPVGEDRVPTQSTIQLTLQPVYSRNQLINFKVQDIAEGKKLGFI